MKTPRRVLLALISLLAFAPVSRAEKGPEPVDPTMRRIVAEYQTAASAVPRRFRAELSTARRECGTHCDPETLFQAVVKSLTQAEQKLSSALQTADRRLKERARSLKSADAVPGAAGDLTHSVARLEMTSLATATEMSDSLSALKGRGFGGAPLLTTLQLRFVSLVYKIPIGWGGTLTLHTAGAPTAFLHMSGTAPPGTPVTITITCGGAPQTIQLVASEDGFWGFSTTVTFSGAATVCTVTATAGSGISAGSFTTDVAFQ